MERPEWWEWELSFTSHVESRMEERGFSEVELRAMLQAAHDDLPARRVGRWVVHTRLGSEPWVVVLEPDEDATLLIIVTAYRRESKP